MLPALSELRSIAHEIFKTALHSVEVGAALRHAVRLDGSSLSIFDTTIDLTASGSRVYAVAIGKAAPALAAALDSALGSRLTAGVISGPPGAKDQSDATLAADRWQYFSGGHPLPNQESLLAARSCCELLRRAEQERALVLFLISGGGSAMLEWPVVAEITLPELIAANRLLVSCGASIAEINAVRREMSALKGGKLAGLAPHATQVTLLVSDTNSGDEASVASGPTIAPGAAAPDALAVINRYSVLRGLPSSILTAVELGSKGELATPTKGSAPESPLRKHYVLLDNHTALVAAAAAARQYGFFTDIAYDIVEPRIAAGCHALLSRLEHLRSQMGPGQKAVCLISGGELLCPVRGAGVGGRNAETVLRWAIEIDQAANSANGGHLVVLSAGTDGIDGNSPAAGALADETTMARARALGLAARHFLEDSDAFSFFQKLGDDIVIGPTGTNVRDVRIMLAR